MLTSQPHLPSELAVGESILQSFCMCLQFSSTSFTSHSNFWNVPDIDQMSAFPRCLSVLTVYYLQYISLYLHLLHGNMLAATFYGNPGYFLPLQSRCTLKLRLQCAKGNLYHSSHFEGSEAGSQVLTTSLFLRWCMGAGPRWDRSA